SLMTDTGSCFLVHSSRFSVAAAAAGGGLLAAAAAALVAAAEQPAEQAVAGGAAAVRRARVAAGLLAGGGDGDFLLDRLADHAAAGGLLAHRDALGHAGGGLGWHAAAGLASVGPRHRLRP